MTDKEENTIKKRNVKPIIFLLFIVAVGGILILLLGKDSLFRLPQPPRVKQGSPAPDFSYKMLDGSMVSLSDYRGKVVLINIWATWCPPCVEEMPSMEKLYQELRGQDFEILAVSIDALGAEVVGPFMKKYNLSFPALLDPKGTIQRLYGTTGVPESFVIDKKGVIARVVIGPLDWSTPETIDLFRNLLGKP